MYVIKYLISHYLEIYYNKTSTKNEMAFNVSKMGILNEDKDLYFIYILYFIFYILYFNKY